MRILPAACAGLKLPRIERETPVLFEQLVYRAVNEEDISVQRGAELLKVPFSNILAMLRFSEM